MPSTKVGTAIISLQLAESAEEMEKSLKSKDSFRDMLQKAAAATPIAKDLREGRGMASARFIVSSSCTRI